MIYVMYLILAAAVVFLSMKCAEYVDLLDKKTNLSGAFIGGVILAAVTSLPELFTSISALFILKTPRPELILGNILGSNLFNIAALAVLTILMAKAFARNAKLMKSHIPTILFTALLYVVLIVNLFVRLDYEILTVSTISLVILVVYAVSVRGMATDENETDDGCDSALTVRQIVWRFVLSAVGLVAASIFVTYFTDKIQQELPWLGATLAGAVLLGVATSLPELTSSVALYKRGNYNAACGNIVGSNIFNMFILFVADVMDWRGGIYIKDRQAILLLLFGFVSMLALLAQILLVRRKKQMSRGWVFLCSGVSVICYLAFLILSLAL